MSDIKTPFSDAIESSPVPKTSSGSVSYDQTCVPDTPGRNGGLIQEVTYDTHWSGPKHSGPITDSPFKDKIGG